MNEVKFSTVSDPDNFSIESHLGTLEATLKIYKDDEGFGIESEFNDNTSHETRAVAYGIFSAIQNQLDDLLKLGIEMAQTMVAQNEEAKADDEADVEEKHPTDGG